MDPGVAKLLERTRARRGELKEFSSDRSPLPSEKDRDRSPLKQINRAVDNSPLKSSPVKKSPRKIDINVEESPSNTIKRLLSRESLENNVKDLISRESPGKICFISSICEHKKYLSSKNILILMLRKYLSSLSNLTWLSEVIQYVPKKTSTCWFDSLQQVEVFFGTYCSLLFSVLLVRKVHLDNNCQIQYVLCLDHVPPDPKPVFRMDPCLWVHDLTNNEKLF